MKDYFQADGGWLLDTESKNAFHAAVGPTYALGNNYHIGGLVGGLVREAHYPPQSRTFGPRKFYSTGDDFGRGRRGSYELLLLYGITGRYDCGPVALEALLNHQLLNLGLALRIPL